MTRPIDELLVPWREEAATSRRRGLTFHAMTIESLADELGEWWDERQEELLNQTEAAYEIARSTSTIARWAKEGRLVSHGEPNAPKYRRSELWAAARGIEGVEEPAEGQLPDDTSGKIRQIARRRSG